MSDEAALLRAIAAHPEEDTPRLAYADWLDEAGSEVAVARAEYIRIQVARQRGLADPSTDERLYKREVELYVEYAGTWRRELPDEYYVPVIAAQRGFWYRAAAPASAVLAAADNPYTHLIDELTVCPPVSAGQLRDILRLPYAPRLTALVLCGAGSALGADGAATVAAAELPRLVTLAFSGNWIGDDGVRALCRTTGLPALRNLDLSSNEIADGGADALVGSELIRRLRNLGLRGNPIPELAARRLIHNFPEVVGLPNPIDST
jgi:uncharacterized protein (TIGR02996 family)